MIELRAYQTNQIRLSRESFAKGNKRIILASPTGSGKSILIAEMVKQSYEKGKRIYILTHRLELFLSTLKHISNNNIPCVELKAGTKMPQGDYRVLLAMEKTLWNRIQIQPESVLSPDIILADEIHFNNFTKIINYFPNAYLIGYSATPMGKHIFKTYQDIIQTVDVPELIEKGFLVKIFALQMTDKEENKINKIKISKGDFDTAELFKHYNTKERYKGVLDGYNEKLKGLKGIIFCVNVQHSINTWQTFKDAGLPSYIVHSNMSAEERNYNVKEFESSSDGIMINCGILCVGYDHAPIRFVIQDFATTSLPKFLQTIGRGSRPDKDKEIFFVLDYGKNHDRHGLWNMNRKWELKEKKKRKDQPMPVRSCPSCGAMLPASSRQCEYCKYEFPKPAPELREGVLCEVDTGTPIALKGKRVSELSLSEIADLQRTKKYKSSYCWRLIRSRGIDALKEYAGMFQYKQGWVFAQAQKMDDSKFANYIIK